MKFRYRAWVGALVFACTLVSGQLAAWADNDGDGDQEFVVQTLSLQQLQAAAAQSPKTVPFSSTPIVPTEYNGDVRDLPPDWRPRDYLHHWNEFPTPLPVRMVPSSTQATTPIPPQLDAPMPSPLH